jgi:hypothetical protein
MVLIHRVIRREFGQLPRLFRSAANDRPRSKVIGAHAREMLHFLHTHHTGEDELLFPLLRQRAALDPELMDRMDAQHAQVNDAVAAVGAELPAWTASADAAAGERMAALIDATMPTLIDHLAEEEQKLLPIGSVTLTQSEWDALGKHGMSAIPVTRRLVILADLRLLQEPQHAMFGEEARSMASNAGAKTAGVDGVTVAQIKAAGGGGGSPGAQGKVVFTGAWQVGQRADAEVGQQRPGVVDAVTDQCDPDAAGPQDLKERYRVVIQPGRRGGQLAILAD